MSGEVKFFIKRDDGQYYAGTNDKKPVYTEAKQRSAGFKTREAAQQRMIGLPPRDNGSYEIEVGALPVRKSAPCRCERSRKSEPTA